MPAQRLRAAGQIHMQQPGQRGLAVVGTGQVMFDAKRDVGHAAHLRIAGQVDALPAIGFQTQFPGLAQAVAQQRRRGIRVHCRIAFPRNTGFHLHATLAHGEAGFDEIRAIGCDRVFGAGVTHHTQQRETAGDHR